MQKSFIAHFEKKLLNFEEELQELVVSLFKIKDEYTTYEIGNYLNRHSTKFLKLKEYNRIKAWYRLRKILESLEKEGVLKREMSGKNLKNLRFLNYRWIKMINRL